MHGFSRNYRVRSKLKSSKTIYWKIRTIEHHLLWFCKSILQVCKNFCRFLQILVNFGEIPTTGNLPKCDQNLVKFTHKSWDLQNRSKSYSIVLIFQYVVYKDFSGLTLKFCENPWLSGVLKRQITPYCGCLPRAIFYARYLIQIKMYIGDICIFDASSLDILHSCNVRKWFCTL